MMQTKKKKNLTLVDLLQKTDYIAKVIEIQRKIPSITGLADTG